MPRLVHRTCLTSLCLGMALALLPGCKGDPKSPEFWEKQVKDARRSADRVKVYEELRGSGNLNPTFLPMLHAALAAEKKGDVKVAIARDLAALKSKESVQPLADVVDFAGTDSDAHKLNREIASALGAIGDPGAASVLLKLVNSKDRYVQVESIQALGTLRAPAAVDPLVALAQDEGGEPFINKKAIQALGDIGDPRAVPALVKAMFKTHPRGPSFYAESSYALFQIGKPAADALVPVVAGSDAALNAWAKQNGIDPAALYMKSAQVLGDLRDARAEAGLLGRLSYRSEDAGVQMLVRTAAADALGRLRAKSAVKPITALIEKQLPSGKANQPAADSDPLDARLQYAQALGWIGGRDAIPTLLKTTDAPIWDAREASAGAIGLLGDEREVAAVQALVAAEPARTEKDCQEFEGYEGCRDPKALGAKHVAILQGHVAQLEAAKACREDVACWRGKLEDKVGLVRQRAALELGRSGKAGEIDALLKHVSDPDLDARLAVIQGVNWLTGDSKEAFQKASASVDAIDKQLSSEHGKGNLVRVNEDLRRLSAQLKRQGS